MSSEGVVSTGLDVSGKCDLEKVAGPRLLFAQNEYPARTPKVEGIGFLDGRYSCA